MERNTPVILLSERRKFLVKVSGEHEVLDNFGVIDTSKLFDKEFGDKITLGDEEFVILDPTLDDVVECMERKAQIIRAKDAAIIIMRANIKSGNVVVEGGSGSGALTVALLRAVSPNGKVITYEIREDFAKIARKNVEKMNLQNIWTLKIGDVRKDVSEKDVDAFILDIPDPWNAVNMAKKSLRGGGIFCAYIPTYNQLEKVFKELKENGFVDVKAYEILEREIIVHDMGTRPSNEYIGHTAFIVFGRKVN